MIVIGIVGSPAGGKSTVATRLQDLGATWINADQIARSVLESADVQSQLVARFGSAILGKDGMIDRARLADIVFGDDDRSRDALNYLQGLTHPPTRAKILATLQQCHRQNVDVSILDVPLLFESHWDTSCDAVWCVDCPFEIRLARAANRGWDASELKRREHNQLSIEEKRRRSTLILDNSDSLQHLIQQVDAAHQLLIDRMLIDRSSRNESNEHDNHCDGH